jgi:hypothetical protein
MKRWAVVFLAFAMTACARPGIEPGPGKGEFTLSYPADVFLSRPMLDHRAAIKSGYLCPHGYTVLDKADTPSAVTWHIRCESGMAHDLTGE